MSSVRPARPHRCGRTRRRPPRRAAPAVGGRRQPADLGVLDRLDGRTPSRGEPGDGAARGLPPRHSPLRSRLPALLRRRRSAATDELDDRGVARRRSTSAPALGAGSFVFIGGDPLVRDRLRRARGPRHRRARGAGAVLLQQPRRRADGRRPRAQAGRGLLTPLVSIDGPRDGQRRAARPRQLRRRDGVHRRAAGRRPASRWRTPCSCGRRCPACRSSRASCAPPGSAGCTSSCRTSAA